MAQEKKSLIISDKFVANKIYPIRGQKVMPDRYPAELYGVETKLLKEAVRRNISLIFEYPKQLFNPAAHIQRPIPAVEIQQAA